MGTLTINYDRKYDTLYVDIPTEEPTYGEGGENGIVTFLGLESDRVLGFMIDNFKARLSQKRLSNKDIPIEMDIYDPLVLSLVYGEGNDQKTVIYS